MSTKYSQPNAKNILGNIRKLYSNANLMASQLQTVVLELITVASELDKKAILDETGDVGLALDYLFRNSPKGMDRGTLSAWFVATTPIRPRFNKANGHYEGYGFARKGGWDLELAAMRPWYEADPESTRDVKVPEIDAQINSLMLAMAKLVAVSDGVTADDVATSLQEKMVNAKSAIMEKMQEDSVERFTDAYTAQKTS